MIMIIDGRTLSQKERELIHTCMCQSNCGTEGDPDFLSKEEQTDVDRLIAEIKGE